VVPVQPPIAALVQFAGAAFARLWDMSARLAAVIGAASLVVGTASMASAGTPGRPLTPAALASALERHPFPTTNLGYTVTFLGSQPPKRAGDIWTLSWQAPATAPKVTFQFDIFSDVKSADTDWRSWISGAEEFKEKIWDLSTPYPAWCGGGAKGYFSCLWIDANVQMLCYGGSPATESSLCQGLFVASGKDLREVDPHGGF
jgi:hypothetical protein